MLLSWLLKTKEGNMDYTHQFIYIYSQNYAHTYHICCI